VDRAEKAQLVGELRDRFKQATVAMLAIPQGLSVAEVQQLRHALREAGGEYKVAKNTLARRAIQDTAFASLNDLLQGPSGLVLGYADPVTVAKALVRYAESTDKLSIKGGVLDQRLLEPAAVTQLAKLPSREVLLGSLLGLLQAPAAQLLRTIQEPAARLARLLDQVRAGREQNA
jgi:large subunit ribosomal protein L10